LFFAQGDFCPSLQLIPHAVSGGVPNAYSLRQGWRAGSGRFKSSAESRQVLGP